MEDFGRFRVLRAPGITGKQSSWNNPGGITHTAYGSESTCNDRNGDLWGENPLLITHSTTVAFGVLNGRSPSTAWVEYKNVPVSSCRTRFNPTMQMKPSFSDVNKAIANSHPGEPPLSIPLFLYELKDVPSMMKHAVDRANALEDAAQGPGIRQIRKYLSNPKNPAEDWLNYHFGWAPLMSDLVSLIDIPSFLKRRLYLLNKGRRIRTRSQLGHFSNHYQNQFDVYDTTAGLYGVSTVSETAKSWVVAHWMHDLTVSRAMLTDGFSAIKGSLGLDVSISDIWNGIPYSWLVDWFAGVGDLIHIKSNRNGLKFLNASVMTHQVIRKTSIPKAVPKWLTATPAAWKYETKERREHFPTLPSILGVNILSPGHLATLASLKVTRGSRVAF